MARGAFRRRNEFASVPLCTPTARRRPAAASTGHEAAVLIAWRFSAATGIAKKCWGLASDQCQSRDCISQSTPAATVNLTVNVPQSQPLTLNRGLNYPARESEKRTQEISYRVASIGGHEATVCALRLRTCLGLRCVDCGNSGNSGNKASKYMIMISLIVPT